MTINDYPKKKLIVADILRIVNNDENSVFIIRDITPASHAPGPNGDGIIYGGDQEGLLYSGDGNVNPICSMEVVSMEQHRGYNDSGYRLVVIKNNSQCQCKRCGSTFISGDNEKMMTYMCMRCGSEMEIVKE